MARRSVRAPDCSTWNSPNRTACCSSGLPSTSTSAASQNSSRYARCSRTSPSQPVKRAPDSAPATWSRTAASERRLDHPYPISFTTRSCSPGCSVQAIVRRAQSWLTATSVSVRPGASTMCPMPAPMRRPLARVRCSSTIERSSRSCATGWRGRSSTAATRGSRDSRGCCSFATSSDCRVIRAARSTGSTTYSMAAIARCENDTSRRERTRTRVCALDVRYGDLHDHHRRLDLRTGMLERTVDWTSTAQTRVRVRSRRLVSFSQRAIAAIEYVVEPVERAARITLQSELVANEQQPRLSRDPRVAAVLDRPLQPVAQDRDDLSIVLLHRTRASGLLMGAGMGHIVEAPGRTETEVAVSQDWARLTIACTLQPGEQLRVVK